MTLPDSEFRLIGVAAALCGLVVMMFASQPSVASLSSGCLGLVLFGMSRLTPRPRPKQELDFVAEVTAAPPARAGDAAEGDEDDGAVAPMPGDFHVLLQRKVSEKRPASPVMKSSVLPPSRSSRSPSTP